MSDSPSITVRGRRMSIALNAGERSCAPHVSEATLSSNGRHVSVTLTASNERQHEHAERANL